MSQCREGRKGRGWRGGRRDSGSSESFGGGSEGESVAGESVAGKSDCGRKRGRMSKCRAVGARGSQGLQHPPTQAPNP